MSQGSNRSRRAFLGGAGRAAAMMLGGGLVARAASADPSPTVARDAVPPPIGTPTPGVCAVHDDLPRDADVAVTAFAGELGPGTALGAWTLVRLHAVFRGALPFVLAHPDGRKAQVDLMAACGESPPGIASTGAGHLYLVNSGRGTATTPRDLEHAIGVLAARLAHRDGAALGLMSFAERHRCHPGGVFVVPV